jgi:hypothetical protein
MKPTASATHQAKALPHMGSVEFFRSANQLLNDVSEERRATPGMVGDGIIAAKKCSTDTTDKTMVEAFFIFWNGFISSQSHSSTPFTMANGELRN